MSTESERNHGLSATGMCDAWTLARLQGADHERDELRVSGCSNRRTCSARGNGIATHAARSEGSERQSYAGH
jgi:hypothetical protein